MYSFLRSRRTRPSSVVIPTSWKRPSSGADSLVTDIWEMSSAITGRTGTNSARKSPGWTDGITLSTFSTALRGKGFAAGTRKHREGCQRCGGFVAASGSRISSEHGK